MQPRATVIAYACGVSCLNNLDLRQVSDKSITLIDSLKIK